jgi:hypothetical protein
MRAGVAPTIDWPVVTPKRSRSAAASAASAAHHAGVVASK